MKTYTIPLWITLLALTCSTPLLAGTGKASKKSKAKVMKIAPTLSVTPPPIVEPPVAEEITMQVSETRTIPYPKVGRMAVGDNKVLGATIADGKEILLIANEEGVSMLHIWDTKGNSRRLKVNVLPNTTDRATREITTFLSSIPNTKVSVVGSNIVVEGEQLSDFDLLKIDALKERYPQIIDFSNRVGWEKMVVMEVKVCEFPVTELREMGIKWNAAGGIAAGAIWRPLSKGGGYTLNSKYESPIGPLEGGGALTYPSAMNGAIGVNLGLDAQLRLMAQNGRAAILAEPILSARNGAKASFLAGGEIPYAVQSLLGTTIVYKQYGVKLEIQPKIDASGVIRAKIDSEVSSIDNAVTALGAPALNTRKTTTEFNVKDGETLVLSGFLSRDVNTSIDKIPFLGDIPMLGALFRSKRFQNKETELVVFVTPHLMDSRTPELAERVKIAEERLSNVPRAVPTEPKVQPKKTDLVNRPAWGQAIP